MTTHAAKPSNIPKSDWKEIFKRVKTQIKDDHIQIIAAGIAFYSFLSIFPTIAAAISIYGLVMDPMEVQAQLSKLASILPTEAHQLISGILEKTANKSDSSLGWSLIISILLSLWSANKGTTAIFEGINVAYDEMDERHFIKKYLITLGCTLGGLIVALLCMLLVIGFPAFVDQLPFGDGLKSVINWLRWPIMAGIIAISLSFIYKIAPDRDNPEFRWVSWGAVVSTVFWIVASLLFSLYVNNFGSYDQTYGSFAAVIILMLWFFITAFIILLGAEINSEMEHQTTYDTTVGPYEPMGERGAYHADNLPGKEKSTGKHHSETSTEANMATHQPQASRGIENSGTLSHLGKKKI